MLLNCFGNILNSSICDAYSVYKYNLELMEMETEICEWDFMYVKNALALTHAHTQIASQSHITY